MHCIVQLTASSTRSNRSFDVLAVLIRQNFSSPVMQTASSAEAMPPFARLDVNIGWQLFKLKHRAAQIKTKIASKPRIEGLESGSSRAREEERRVEGRRAHHDRDPKHRGARTMTT